MEPKILKLLITALGFLTLLVVGLAVLFGLALKEVKNSIQVAQGDVDIVNAIKSLRVINGQNGAQGLPGIDGLNGRNATSTVVQQPIKGDRGDAGSPGTPAPKVLFDGNGNFKYEGDDVWQPLFQTSTGAE